METTAAPTAETGFVPRDLDASRWDRIEPLYRSLVSRELRCAGCLERLLLDRSELDAAASEAHTNLYIGMTCHTDDEAARSAYLEFIEHVEPKLKETGFELDKRIVSSPHAAALDRKRYEVLLRDLKADVEIFRPENIPLQTEEKKLDQQYEEICGAMTVSFRGQERTLPQMSRFLEETDRATREEAWRGIWDRRHVDRDRIEEIFDRMIELRGAMARNAGLGNFRDYLFKRRHRFDYTPADCEAFHRGAESVCVPLMRRLNAERAKALRVSPLRPWDLAVDVRGRAPLRPFEGAAQLVERSARVFHRMHPALGAMFDALRGGDCLDLDSRKGKAPGGYQAYRDRTRRCFIFMNSAGLHRDLETMLHEAGHAFHSTLCRDESLLHYRHAPIEFAEVASMTMELLGHPFLDEFYDEAGAARARRRHLEDLAVLLPWIAIIDAFQHWIYTNPGHSRQERTAFWEELDRRFGPAVSWSGLEHFRAASWQRQGHLFGVPFYYIEYGIAQLGALQLWLQSRREPAAAIENYQRALALGGSRPLPELFKAAGLRFEFGPQLMQRLMDEVQKELETLPA